MPSEMATNMDSFRLNIFLESTRFKSHKKQIYASLIVLYIVMSALSGIKLYHSIVQVVALLCLVVAAFGTRLGRAAVSSLASRVNWSKLGYSTVKIVGCESVLEETSWELFLHQNSAVGQIAEWIKQKAGVPRNGKVELVWAGRILDPKDRIPSNATSLIAILHQENVDASLHLGQNGRIIRSSNSVPTNPDFDFNPEDDESVPSFIYDMMSDDDDDDEDEKAKISEKFIETKKTLVSSIHRVVNMFEELTQDFRDSPWLLEDGFKLENIEAPVAVPPTQPLQESDSDSDAEDTEAPSFLREMNSTFDEDENDDDDDDVEFEVAVVRPGPIEVMLGRWKKSMKAWKSKFFSKFRPSQVSDEPSRIQTTKAKDMITLDEDDEEVRYVMPCGFERHSMSQSSLLQYMKNQVVGADKKHQITCPEGSCTRKDWDFGHLCEILQDGEFKFPEEELTRIEKELSANLISREKNCQRCPQCEIVLCNNLQNDRYDKECFGCGASFCWCCRSPWDTEAGACLNPKCTTAWRFVAAKMLENCPRKQLDHMANVPTMRACPECGQLITHVVACKHMRCSLCSTRFCFVCMKPQKNGGWQCGYDANSCKLHPVQKVDALADGRVVRTNILERVSPQVFKEFAVTNIEESRKAQEQFITDVMAGVRSSTLFN